MAMSSLSPRNDLEDFSTMQAGAASSRQQQQQQHQQQHRRIPSFKLVDDEHTRSKRLRNRVPGFGLGEGAGKGSLSPSPFVSMFDQNAVVPVSGAVGPRRVSSFTLGSDTSNDVRNSNNNNNDMTHTTSWSSVVVGSNCFDFIGPASIDEDGEYIQRLDDATLDDLNFFSMDDMVVSPVTLPPAQQRDQQQEQEEQQQKTLRDAMIEDSAANEISAGSIIDRFSGGDHLGNSSSSRRGSQASNPGEEGSAAVKQEEGGRFGGRDMLVGMDIVDRPQTDDAADNIAGDVLLETNVFDPDGRLPSFSAPMEEYLNRQLEAAERSLHVRNFDERRFGGATADSITDDSGGGGGGGGGGGDLFSMPMHTATAAEGDIPTSPPALAPARSVVVKCEQEVHMSLAKENHRETAPLPHLAEGGAGAFEPSNEMGNNSSSYAVGIQQQQQQQQQQQYESEEEAESSHSEYEPPPPPAAGGQAEEVS